MSPNLSAKGYFRLLKSLIGTGQGGKGGSWEVGFTELNVESTWIEGCGEYLLDTEKWTLSNGEVTLIGKSLLVWKKEDGIWKMYKDMINTDIP